MGKKWTWEVHIESILLSQWFRDYLSRIRWVLWSFTQDSFTAYNYIKHIWIWTQQIHIYIQKTKIMAFSPITSWQDEETMEIVTDFIFLGSKITADGDWSHDIKRHLLLGRKALTNLDIILKSRNITLSTKVHLIKAMVFPGVMYGCES